MTPLRRIVAFTIMTATLLFAQSREDLRAKFGDRTSETFTVLPGIGVTASYGPGGQLTELVIAPQISDSIKSRNTTLPRDTVDRLLTELVPPSRRGKLIMSSFVHLHCLPELDCVGASESYEKLHIYFNAGKDGTLHYVVVHWKE